MQTSEPRKVKGLVLLFLLITGAAQAQQTNAFTMAQCVAYAEKNSPQVKNALLNIKIQQETNNEITGAALPRVNASAGVNYFPQVATQVFPNFIAAATYGVLVKEGVRDGNGNTIAAPNDFGFVQAQFGTKYTASVGADFSQLLFDGQVFVGLQARAAAMNFARKSAEVTTENIKVNIMKVYFQLVAAKKQMDALDANLHLIEKLAFNTKELVKNGFSEKLDIDKVNVTLTNLQTEIVKINRQIDNGYLGLKLLMGMPTTDSLILTDTVSIDELKSNVLEAAYNYNDRKEMQQLLIAQKLGEYNVKRYQLAKIPTLALFGQYSTNAQRNQLDFGDSKQPWLPSSLIGLKLSAPIFQGFSRNATIRKARYELEQTKNNVDLLKLSIDNDVARAKSSLQNAILTLDYQQKNMELATSVYNTTVKKYEQGLGANIEVTNAQTELRVAQTNYFNALYDAIIAKIDFQKATGKL